MAAETLFERERNALAKLVRLARERAASETAVADRYQTETESAERDATKGRRQAEANKARRATEVEADHATKRAEIDGAAEAGRATAAARRADAVRKLNDKADAAENDARTRHKEKLWTLASVLEAGEKEADDARVKLERQVTEAEERIAGYWEGIAPFLARVGLKQADVSFPEEKLPTPTQTDPVGKLEKCMEDCAAAAERVAKPYAMTLNAPAGTLLLAALAGLVCAGIGFAFGTLTTAAIDGVIGFVLGGFILWLLVKQLARRQVRDRGRALGVYQAEAARAARTLSVHAKKQCGDAKAELRRRHDNDTQRANEKYLPFLSELNAQRDAKHEEIKGEHAHEEKRLLRDLVFASRDEDDRYAAAQKAATEADATEAADVENTFETRTATALADRDRDWSALFTAWTTGLEEVRNELTDLKQTGESAFPDWATIASAGLPEIVPLGVRFGELTVDLNGIPDGPSSDPRLQPASPLALTLPAFLPFPDKAAILLKAKDEGRPAAVQLLQMMMLRFLTGLPPGKVRFTILDPVGLGDNFAAFMHLADHDELLVSSRIWTEPPHIEQRLADLTGHMENVIQKYLRNQYKSIEEYNRAAGEVAEPYRVLVVANFPANFTPDAAKRLVSIMTSGPSCGVCTLLSVDSKAAMPRDFRLADLEQVALNFLWKDGRFACQLPEFQPFPLVLDTPPDSATLSTLVQKVGAASKDAARVEVPFEYITPKPEDVWTASAAKGISVPIGRAGATRRQIFRLGSGTAQHALIAGKTGSGKSTLLHALITNLALTYGPGEIDLYLIDFKKGVEFKPYAAHRLPHARVVAIESEREFGLSVLQRLDVELRDRGDKFRTVGANDLAGYREEMDKSRTDPDSPPLSRILLVVDEFQEFFIEDDKLAQEAALLLDRLVRQGRAFGIHVLLGSQTLGGAYSLARSTIDQMAVRIALQCSDADAQLILSKDNNAARLLTRPGEAIYNDANGLLEGNDPFQVVWLNEDKREQILDDLQVRAKGRNLPPPLVFEGNATADLAENPVLAKILAAGRPIEPAKVPLAWVGDPIAITDPTAAAFRPHSAANLLVIGQQEDAALALVAAVTISLAAQAPVSVDPSVRVFDGTPDDAETADYLRKLTTAIGPGCAVIERPEIPASTAALAAEVERRTKGEMTDRSPRFLIVHGMHRFRELRKPDEDFGFGRKGEKQATPGEHFATLLRDGPAVGIHVIVWCDSLTNLQRALDRQAVKEFGLRVLFQMSPTDSSNLLDTPAASKLGRNRALLTRDDQERPEKFRPYGLPDLDWVRRACGAPTPTPSAGTTDRPESAEAALPT
jgi:DNA segregation ATPase FtsK/SpoIIIE-like protein